MSGSSQSDYRERFEWLDDVQLEKLAALESLLREWNAKINLISRKDIDGLRERHILHSLAIAKTLSLPAGAKAMDVGCGGGLPGLPLAILFPKTEFLLIDSTRKKIAAVADMAERLELKNARPLARRIEDVDDKVRFVLGRAVTELPRFLGWTRKNLRTGGPPDMPNGVLYLKGSLYKEELARIGLSPFKAKAIDTFFPEPYFKEKYVVWLTAAAITKARLPRTL